MRILLPLSVGAAFAAIAGASAPARADHAPSVVIPGRPDVPVIINGVDARWGVVEGEWGLYRPGAPPLTVIPSPYVVQPGPANHYFPSAGHAPRSGRYEIEPPAHRPLPPPAQSFHRSWGTASDPSPATIAADPPPVIAASPQIEPGYRRHRRPHPHPPRPPHPPQPPRWPPHR